MKAEDARGVEVPWVYMRREIAARWHVPPYMVDEAPADEVELELAIMQIEGRAVQYRRQRGS